MTKIVIPGSADETKPEKEAPDPVPVFAKFDVGASPPPNPNARPPEPEHPPEFGVVRETDKARHERADIEAEASQMSAEHLDPEDDHATQMFR